MPQRGKGRTKTTQTLIHSNKGRFTWLDRVNRLFPPTTMHPPLYKPHPLCKKEVEDLIKCHEDNPFMKFLDACGPAKRTMDACFREEKKLRVKLNKRLPDAPEEMIVSGTGAASEEKR